VKQSLGDEALEPPTKRHLHSSRMLNYASGNPAEPVTLKQKLAEIQFP